MSISSPVKRFVDLLDPDANVVLNMSVDEAIRRVGSGDPAQVREIDGQFAIAHQQGIIIRMARSIGRPMRYFLAKQIDGPCLIVAERIGEISDFLKAEGLHDQFHPSYTRMVPAHYLTEISLVGCPDPNPNYQRFFTPQRNRLPADIGEIGRAYIGALAQEIDRWLDSIEPDAPIGVLFSGGVDSGAVLLTAYHLLLARGQAPTRLKAFTLSVDGAGQDSSQAAQFLEQIELQYLLETIDVPAAALDAQDAVRTIEDYKSLDVQSATMALALCRGIRERYPDWKYLLDGDGGDENFKDYPIEENSELTIRSVLNNPLLYHEGWGVDKVKHSLTYSGGQSRGHVRTYCPARRYGFCGFSPHAAPNVIDVSEGVPFIELTDWDHQRLYALKGEAMRRGVEALTGICMPVFEKRRFQHGAADDATFRQVFAAGEAAHRKTLATAYE